MTPKELRDWIGLIDIDGYDYRKPSVRDIQDQLEEHASALERLAELEGHADELKAALEWVEAEIEANDGTRPGRILGCVVSALCAYRAWRGTK